MGPKCRAKEKEKAYKYQDLAADLADQAKGYKVCTVAVVIGSLGTICNLRKLKTLGLFNSEGVTKEYYQCARLT